MRKRKRNGGRGTGNGERSWGGVATEGALVLYFRRQILSPRTGGQRPAEGGVATPRSTGCWYGYFTSWMGNSGSNLLSFLAAAKGCS